MQGYMHSERASEIIGDHDGALFRLLIHDPIAVGTIGIP
jgi:hypothetical protein